MSNPYTPTSYGHAGLGAAPAAPHTAAPSVPPSTPETQATPAPPSDQGSALLADPAFNVFIQRLGLSQGDLQNAAQLKANTLRDTEAGMEPRLQRGEDYNQQQLANRFEARGILNSSERLGAQQHEANAYADRLAAMHAAYANNLANVAQQLALQIAQGNGNAALQGQTAAGNLSIADQTGASTR